jgi:hypothetical protein
MIDLVGVAVACVLIVVLFMGAAGLGLALSMFGLSCFLGLTSSEADFPAAQSLLVGVALLAIAAVSWRIWVPLDSAYKRLERAVFGAPLVSFPAFQPLGRWIGSKTARFERRLIAAIDVSLTLGALGVLGAVALVCGYGLLLGLVGIFFDSGREPLVSNIAFIAGFLPALVLCWRYLVPLNALFDFKWNALVVTEPKA